MLCVTSMAMFFKELVVGKRHHICWNNNCITPGTMFKNEFDHSVKESQLAVLCQN